MVDSEANVLVHNWWAMALRGAAALIFGLLTLRDPALTLSVLILFFGAYALVDGLFTIVAALRGRQGEQPWIALLISGVLSFAIGVLTFFMPGVTALVLLYLIAAWAMVLGVAQVFAGIRLRKVITGEWVLILAGVLSVVFGAALLLFPGLGALAVATWIGAYAVAFGILLIVLAFRLRSWGQRRAAPPVVPTA